MAAIFLLALCYRGLCYLDVGAHPLFRYPVVDAGQHDAWAQRIVAGNWLGRGPDDVFKPPLYPYFLAGMYGLGGRHIWLVQGTQFVLGALSCVLLAALGARLLGRPVGVVAGVISAFYAPYVFFEMQLLTPALSIFLNLSAMLLLLSATREGPAVQPAEGEKAARQRPELKSWSYARLLAAGGLLGISAGVRPDVLLPAFLVLAYLLWSMRHMPWRPWIAGGVCLAGGLALAIVPVTWRNYCITQRFILVSSNAGMNFYIGNSASADGISSVPVGLRWERMVARVPQEVLEDPAAAGRWWTRAAWHDIEAAPLAAVCRLAKKAAAVFNCREFRNNICYHFMQQRSWLLRVNPLQFAAVLPMAAWGLVRLWRRGTAPQRRACVLCLLWVTGYWIAGVAYFVTARFRLPALPFLILPAAWGAVEVVRAIRQRHYRTLVGCAAVVLLSGALCWPMWFGRPQDAWALDQVNLGNSLSAAGDRRGAAEAYRRALEYDVNDPDAHYLLAHLSAEASPGVALEHFQAAQHLLPGSPDALLNTAQLFLARRDPVAARATLHELLHESTQSNLWPRRQAWALTHILLADLEPSSAEAHWQEAWRIDPRTAAEAALMGRRELTRVLETFQAAADEQPWDWYAQANYGMILLELNRPAQAATAFREAARLSPQRQGLSFHLAVALFRAGEKDQALAILDDLDKTASGPLRQDIAALRARIGRPD